MLEVFGVALRLNSCGPVRQLLVQMKDFKRPVEPWGNHLSCGLLAMYQERRNLHSCSLWWSGRNLQLAQLVSVGEVAQLEESFRLGFSLCDVCHHYKNDGLCIMTYKVISLDRFLLFSSVVKSHILSGH